MQESRFSLKRIRRVCNVVAVFLIVCGIVVLLVATLTPVWLRQKEDTLPPALSAGSRRDRHTVGLLEDCLMSERFDEPNVCEAKLGFTFAVNAPANGARINTLRLRNSDEKVDGGARWRRRVLFLLIAAIVCSIESFQLALCALYLRPVSVIWTFFSVTSAFLVLIAIFVLQASVVDEYDVDTFSHTDAATAAFETYTVGYSYHCAVWACGILFAVALLSLVATSAAIVDYFRSKSRNRRLPIYDMRRLESL